MSHIKSYLKEVTEDKVYVIRIEGMGWSENSRFGNKETHGLSN